MAYFPESLGPPLKEATVAIDPLRPASELAPLSRGCKVRAKRTKWKVQDPRTEKDIRTDVLDSSSRA